METEETTPFTCTREIMTSLIDGQTVEWWDVKFLGQHLANCSDADTAKKIVVTLNSYLKFQALAKITVEELEKLDAGLLPQEYQEKRSKMIEWFKELIEAKVE